MSLSDFIEQRITGPLKMRDTHFFVPKEDEDRLAVVYGSSDGDTAVRAADGPRGQGSFTDGPRMSYSGGAGLTSTASDYARFLEMLRNGGVLDGVRILAPATVALMTTNQTDTLFSNSGVGFGLGFYIILRPGAEGRVESVGTFGWAGAYGTTYEVDPRQRLVIVFMTQLLPDHTTIAARLPMLVYQALTDYKP
jgi:CubicO group peptidase (beta-lactamase class C family)